MPTVRYDSAVDDAADEATLHPAAAAFGHAAGAYESARPGYPPAAVRWLAERAAIGEDRRVVDLAAGTGKLTRALAGLGAEVVAVEPVAGMRRALAQSVPQVSVVAGLAAALPLATASADAVTVAQAFHWFATRAALAEIHRVLRPGTHLVVLWNRRDLTDPLQAELGRIMAPHRGGAPSFETGAWRAVLEAPSSESPDGGAPFTFEGEHRVRWSHPVDVEGVADRVASVSFIAALPASRRAELLDEVRAAARQQRPPLSLRYTTELYCYSRSG